MHTHPRPRRPWGAAACLALALSACGALPAPPDEVPDPDAPVLASRTFTLPAPSDPADEDAAARGARGSALAVTLDVRGSALPGRRAAHATFALAGGGRVAGEYRLVLRGPRGARGPDLALREGPLALKAPETAERGTAARVAPFGSCARLEYRLAGAGGRPVLDTRGAPLEICEGDLDPDAVRTALTRAAAGLNYVSETDAPWTWVDAGPAARLPSPAAFAARADLHGLRGPGVEVETRDADAFLARLARPADPYDPESVAAAEGYARLKAAFEGLYDERRVYRVRDTATNAAEWRVFVLGRNARGVSGLWTISVET